MDLFSQADRCRIGKVVKSTSHCDYVVQVDDQQDVPTPPALKTAVLVSLSALIVRVDTGQWG
ncbi:MAG: hypothetical protein LVS60_11505 [Nodosilinea sp. LVE1205-7]|jgi:hypothetical protein